MITLYIILSLCIYIYIYDSNYYFFKKRHIHELNVHLQEQVRGQFLVVEIQPENPRAWPIDPFFFLLLCALTKQRERKNKTMATTLGLLLTTPNPHRKSLQIYSSSLPKHLHPSSLPSHKDPSHDLQNLHKSVSHLTLSTLPTAAALTLSFLLAPQNTHVSISKHN